MPALLIVTIAGIAMQAYAQHKAGQAAEKAGQGQAEISRSQAEVADYNSQVAALQSADAVARGQEQENKFRDQVRGVIGRQRTQFAAGNVDVGFGSAVDTQADAAYLGELDALTIRTNAAREAWGYDVQAYNYARQAEIDRKAAKNQIQAGENAATAGNWQAGSTIVAGAGSLLQQRYGFQGAK